MFGAGTQGDHGRGLALKWSLLFVFVCLGFRGSGFKAVLCLGCSEFTVSWVWDTGFQAGFRFDDMLGSSACVDLLATF